MKRCTRGVLFLTVLMLLAVACARDEPGIEGAPKAEQTFPADTYMAELQDKGKIVIGIKYDIPQFGFLNPVSRQPEGFDVDLGKIIADRIGVEPQFVEAVSDARIPLLEQGKVDLIISTMTINEQRKKQIDFSVVYYLAQQRLLVKKGSPITDVGALNEGRGRVCSASGSTSEKNIRAIAPQADVILLRTYSECFQLLRNAQADAVTTDDVILTSLLKSDPRNFRLTGKPFSQEPYGMGIRNSDRPGFVEFVNDVIREVKGDGTWVRLYNEWVKPLTGEAGKPPPDDVPPA